MKLARPDIRHPRIVLVGSESGDDAGLVAALRKRGLHARWLSWDDPDTLQADLVILRTVTDYADRLDEFLAWARRVRNLLNAAEVVAWNAGQHHLRDLRHAGVPVRSRRPGGVPNGAGFPRRHTVTRIRRWVAGGCRLRTVGPRPGCPASGGRPAEHRRRRAALRPRRCDRRTGSRRIGRAGSGCAGAGLAAARRHRARRRAAAVRAAASSQPWTGSGSVRSRIDAHNAAVAAVHAAAPATCTATSAAGTPVKNCTVPTVA